MVNPPHLPGNNNRLHTHIVWTARANPLTEADSKNESVSLPAQMSRRGL